MIGKIIKKYKIIKLIGKGGMASIYEAINVDTGHKVAIKILAPELLNKSNLKQRFINEAKITARLNHPNIIKVIDLYEKDNIVAIIMELLEGMSLSDYIKRKGKVSKDEALYIFKQILQAIDYAHKKGIIHRDIKPSNVFLIKEGNALKVKVLDFGIAKLASSDMRMTATGMQMGTPLYMSPEQVKDTKNIDNLTDIYSLGVLLFFMLNGKEPYDIKTLSKFDVFEKIMYEKLPRIKEYGYLNDIIQKATQKKPSDRFLTCSEFYKAIRDKKVNFNKSKSYKKIEKPKKDYVSKNEHKKKKKPVWIFILFLLLILGGVGFFILNKNTFEKTYDIGTYSKGRRIIKTDEGYLLLINAKFPSKDAIVLLNIDKKGNEIWRKIIGGEGETVGKSMIEVSDGYAIAGYRFHKGDKKGVGYIVKVDRQGNTQWDKEITAKGWMVIFGIDKINDNEFIVAGYKQYLTSSSTKKMDKDMWVGRISEDGKLIGEGLVLSSSYNEEAFGVKTVGQKDFVLTGYYKDKENKKHLVVVKYENFKNKWIKKFEGNSKSKGHGIIEAPDGNYIIAGYKNDDAYIVKLNSETGNVIWEKQKGGGYTDEALSIIKDNNDYYVVGYYGAKSGNEKIYLIKIDDSGNIIYDKKIGEDGNQGGQDIVVVDKEFLTIIGRKNINKKNKAYLLKIKK